MLRLLAWISRIRGRLGTSSLEDWPSYLESSRSEGTRRTTVESPPVPIGLASLTPRTLAAVFICYLLLLLGLVFGCTLLISWATAGEATGPSSTAVLPWERSLDGWMARRLYCSAPQPCEDWRPTSPEGRSSLKFERTLEEDDAWVHHYSDC